MDPFDLEEAITNGITLELLLPEINERKCRLQIKHFGRTHYFAAAMVFSHKDVVSYVQLDQGCAFASVAEALRFWLNVLPSYLDVSENDQAIRALKMLLQHTM